MALASRTDSPLLFWVLVTLVCLSPLPFGSVYAWSWAVIACAVGVLLAIWSGRVLIGLQDAPFGLQRTWPVVVPFVLIMLWMSLQASSITLSGWHHPLWDSARTALGEEVSGAISLNSYQSLSEMTRVLAYGGVFWLTLQLCRRSARSRQVITALAFAGALYALYGLISFAIGAKSILWFERPGQGTSLTSTFVSQGTYVAYAGLALICITGLILIVISQKANSIISQMTREAFSTTAVETRVGHTKPKILSTEGLRRFMRGLSWSEGGLLLAWVGVVAASIAAQVQGALAVTFFTIALMIVIYWLAGLTQRNRAVYFAAAVVVAIAVAFLTGGEHLENLFADSTENLERPLVYDLAIAAIEDAPLLGTGAGTFEEVFRFYRTSEIKGYYAMAHSTYLEQILELGLPATILILVIFGAIFFITIRGIAHRRRDVIYPCIGFAATVHIAIHAVIDFSLQIPALTVTYAMIAGATCAQCWSTRRPSDAW
ncbi:MAG: O-antigen ligase family protein [Hyphomicrobiales bacterium]|nr:O-antigen ligase family protein [Hyphomicrobiales bacterium]